MINIKTVGGYCRNFRLHRLKLTLKEVEEGTNVKSLSSFEHGRSSNMYHLFKYVEKCEGREEKIDFLQGLINTIERR